MIVSSSIWKNCLLLFVSLFIISVIKAGVECANRLYYNSRHLMKILHKKIVHVIKLETISMKETNKKIESFELGDFEFAFKQQYDKITDLLQRFTNVISKYLTRYRNKDISVCVKLFCERIPFNKNFENSYVYTVARSNNTSEKRSLEDEKTKIKTNSAYIEICEGRKSFFGCGDLKHKKDYKNNSLNWSSKHSYNSTLVIPIRFYKKTTSLANNSTNINVSIDIIGFICIDSKANLKVWESKDSFEYHFLSLFADILYIYLNDFYNFFTNENRKAS